MSWRSSTTVASSPAAEPIERGFRKTRTGIVVSDRMAKTLVVRVDRLVDHPFYPRTIRASLKLKVHNPSADVVKVGDWVKVMETRPISKTKRWRLVQVIRRGSAAPALPPAGLESAGLEEPGAARKSVKSKRAEESGSP